jgi:hypothetical protein
MWKFLKAGYMEQWQYNRTYCGTPHRVLASVPFWQIFICMNGGIQGRLYKRKQGKPQSESEIRQTEP